MPRLALLAAIVAFLALWATGAHAAQNWNAASPVGSISGCSNAQAGTSAPQVDASLTNMTANQITIVASTAPVPTRKMVLYLGTGSTDAACYATMTSSGTPKCRHVFTLSGTWQALRGCNWSAPTISGGYEVRNNTFYIEYQDSFGNNGNNNKQASIVSFPVSIRLPTTVDVSANTSVLEDSGIKNFNLTGISYQKDDTGRYLILDFQMFSRWPNKLTLADINLPAGLTGTVTVNSYSPPTCVKTDSTTNPFNVSDFCYQNGELKVAIGDTCEVGGAYKFNFNTDCFSNTANNDCTNKVLSANAFVGTQTVPAGPLSLDLCAAINNQVAAVTAVMFADKPEGYFFGDTITLTTVFTSPDLPIYESRLTQLILGRKIVQRSPNIGTAATVTRNLNSTIMEGAAGPATDGNIKTLGINTAFTYTPGTDVVVMTLVPNMLPASPGNDYNVDSFLTTDDFDSLSTFTFYARYRIYFDSVAAAGQRRRRRLSWRDVSVPASALKQTIETASDVDASIKVPSNPNNVQPQTPVTATSSGPSTVVIGAVVGSVCVAALIGGLIIALAVRRRNKRRFEEEAKKSLAKERLMMESTIGVGQSGDIVPDWTSYGASQSFASTGGSYKA